MHVLGWNTGTVVAAGAGLALLVATWPANSQSTPDEITSDTPQYCVHLRDELDGKMPAAPGDIRAELNTLRVEGVRMCDEGETRGGIMRLRRALVLIAHPSGYVAER